MDREDANKMLEAELSKMQEKMEQMKNTILKQEKMLQESNHVKAPRHDCDW